jgi:phosphotransferase system HPr (HPr) family protein
MESREDVSDGTVCEAVVDMERVRRFDVHAAMQFVDTCNLFRSSINARRGTNSADGKSVMEMSILAATCGSKLSIRAEGVDAQDAINALYDMLEIMARDESSQRN